MKALFRNSLIASLCAAAGILAGSSTVVAQTADVDFGLDIPGTCSFGTPNNGDLAQNGTTFYVEGSVGITGLVYGTAGSVELDCTAGGSVTVSAPVIDDVPATYNSSARQAVAAIGAGAVGTSTAVGGNTPWTPLNYPTGAMTVPAGNQTINVGMIAGGDAGDGTLPAGNYAYTVTVTAVSN